MHYRSESEGVPRVNVSISYTDQDWYTTLTRKVTPIIQLEERALVAAGMSMLWTPQNPRAFPVYMYKGKAGYNIMIIFYPNVGGVMFVVALPENRPLWVDQIRGNFLQSSSPQRGATREPAVEGVSTPIVDLQASVSKQAETRKKKKEERTEGKTAEEPVAETPRKRPSNSSALDYVVVSDTLSGLDAGVKRASRDPDDDATLTKMMKKRKILEDKNRELDAQAAAVLSEKKSKFMGPTAAPSESEVDLGVFSKKTGNRLEKIFKSSSAPQGTISFVHLPNLPVQGPRLIFQKLLHLRLLLLSLLIYLLLALTRRGRVRRMTLKLSRRRGWLRTLLLELEELMCMLRVWKQSGNQMKLLLRARYTLRVCAVLEVVVHLAIDRVHRVEGGSWTTHNPACDNLPPAHRWSLTQGSRMDNLPNYCEFYSLSLPSAERLFQKNRHRMDLLDDHIHAGVNYFATTQEIVRKWQAMGEDTMEFEAARKEFAAEREAFNAEKKGLLWRVADNEEKLAKEKQFNAGRRKEWEQACERTNGELKAARDEIVRLKGEKAKESDEHERAVVVYQKRETEYEHRIVTLEKVVAEKTAKSKASEILAKEISADCKWLLMRGVPLIADRIVKSDKLAKYMFELGESAFNSGRKEGYAEGRAAAATNEKVDHFELHKVDCSANYAAKCHEHEFLEFAIVRAVEKLYRKGAAVETLKKALEDQDAETDGAGTSHQV
ncbi:hypothetical protein HanLR1_Chr08g0282581 [Helianthus annuus]|nr:hypothetical protein HanLR1_Chr08g0282581 [Helianthus annuus]